MRVYHFVISTILVFYSISCQGQEDLANLETEQYSISYPSTWQLDLSGQMGMKFVLLSPLALKGDQFKENVNLVVQDLSEYQMDLTDFVNLSEGQIRAMITDANILTSERRKDFHEIVYTGTMGIFTLKFYQRYWVNDTIAYILTFTAEQDQYQNYHTIAQQIMDTFNIK